MEASLEAVPQPASYHMFGGARGELGGQLVYFMHIR